MIQYYCPDIESTPILSESESGHCIRVLRHNAGDEIIVTDGKGNRFLCEILDANPKHTYLKIKQKTFIENIKGYKLTLAVAPTKNAERMEWLVEKAVEIGVDEIVLIECRRSERKRQKTDRLQKIIVSALKQSLEVRLPLLSELISFPQFVKSSDKTGQKFFGYCSEHFPRKEFVKECKAGQNVIVMIGPEGDFTEEEVDLAVKEGFMPVTFGIKRLRTETAGVFAISAVDVINQLND